MSRAFLKEPDEGLPENDVPERPVSEHPNLVTPRGMKLLEAEAGELERRRRELQEREDDALAREQLAYVDRDLRYVRARMVSAQVIDPAAQPRDEVAFGAAVTVGQPDGSSRTFHVVGEDEADLASGRIGYVSPLAVALLGSRVGDKVLWKRPAGDLLLVVAAISYDGEGAGD